jgi:hypothetical protein
MFVWPLATRPKSALLRRMTASAAMFLCDTVSSPFRIVTSQRSVVFPLTSSKRTAPLTLLSNGSYPWLPRSSKKAVAASSVMSLGLLVSLGDPAAALVRERGAGPVDLGLRAVLVCDSLSRFRCAPIVPRSSSHRYGLETRSKSGRRPTARECRRVKQRIGALGARPNRRVVARGGPNGSPARWAGQEGSGSLSPEAITDPGGVKK